VHTYELARNFAAATARKVWCRRQPNFGRRRSARRRASRIWFAPAGKRTAARLRGLTHGEHRRWVRVECGGIWGGVSPLQPTKGSGAASWPPPVESGVEPRPKTDFGVFWRPQNAHFCTYMTKSGGGQFVLASPLLQILGGLVSPVPPWSTPMSRISDWPGLGLWVVWPCLGHCIYYKWIPMNTNIKQSVLLSLLHTDHGI